MKNFFFILLFLIFNNFNNLNALDVKEINYYKDKNVWLVNDNSLPIVAIKFAFKAGSGIDLKGKKGTANLAALLLDEGAGDYSAKEFKQILADNSITLNFNVSHDNFYIDLYTLKENLGLSFQFLDLALTKPTFKLEEINRIKSNVKLALEQSYKDPDEISARLFREILFEGHPYEYDILGVSEDIDKINKEDLENFLENNLYEPVHEYKASCFGNLWQFTSSPYQPYPGYKQSYDAIGEYNGKFMCNQIVLRNGSAITSKSHLRKSYRNFFYPHQRWMYSGIRLADYL